MTSVGGNTVPKNEGREEAAADPTIELDPSLHEAGADSVDRTEESMRFYRVKILLQNGITLVDVANELDEKKY